MLPTPKNYAVFPSVVLADVQTEMTVVPCERAFLLFDGAEYDLTIISVNGDETDYHAPTTHQHLKALAQGGILRFSYCFTGEQEYCILLGREGKKLAKFSIYALREDLYHLMPLKGDFHSHSFRSDGKRDPAAEAGHYREQGYDFYALTDHNRFYPGGEIDEVYQNAGTGFYRVTGEEVHTPGSIVHIVHVGGKEGVANRYLHDRDGFELEIARYEKEVPNTVPEQYRGRYARAMWATDRIHAVGGLAIFPHPYWIPASHVYNVCDEFAKILLSSGMFDAYELVGGMGQVGINRSLALWAELRAEGINLPVVGSSDVHGMERAETFPHNFTICFAEEKENDSICTAVRNGNCVAVEATGNEYDRQYRCYGSLRLVSYAQFLLKTYFHEHQRLCQGEGVTMRLYAMETSSAESVRLQAEQAERHMLRFFGRQTPVLPSSAMLAFEEKWRERHVTEGPATRGSAIDSDTVTRQI